MQICFAIWQVKNGKLLEMHSFFNLANLLGVGKSQDLPSKRQQTLGDALTGGPCQQGQGREEI